MAAEQRVNQDLERDVEERLASLVRSAKADARSAALGRPDWTPRQWTAAASRPGDLASVAPLDLSKVRTEPRPALARASARRSSDSPLMRALVLGAVVLFVAALAIAVLAALGVL